MTDTEFERKSSLILAENYFDRYRHWIGQGLDRTRAWERVEAELYAATGFQKYTTVNSFQHAMGREMELRASKRVVLWTE